MDVSYRLQGLTFEWDAQKASSNAEKHGEAAEAFFDPFFQGGDASVQGQRRV